MFKKLTTRTFLIKKTIKFTFCVSAAYAPKKYYIGELFIKYSLKPDCSK